MRLQVLGCSGGIGSGARTTSFLIDDDILVDAGSGVCDLDAESLAALGHIFVTHSHLDHVLGIPLLIDSLFDRLEAPLQVHALPETIDALSSHLFNWTIWPDFRQLPQPDQSLLCFDPMQPGEVRCIGSRTIEMIAVEHSVPAAAYLIATDGGSRVCFTGDTGPSEEIWRVLNRQAGLDLLIVEAAFSDSHRHLADLAGHYVPTTLVADLSRLEHTPAIAITHLKPGCEEQIMAELHVLDRQRNFHRLQAGDVFTL